ncbi:Ankyrin repeat and death domain-containing protein 1B like [Verticillium longisporum]|nr:Ankyrin repeat and death domain-containing protein 1B like [Verticillium longisporum]
MKKIELAIDSTDHDCTGLAERFFFEDSSRFTSSLLVRQYLDGTYRNPPGSNAYHIAAIYGIEQVFGLGPDQYGLKAQTLDGRNVLHLALENQQWEIVDAILRLGLGDLLSEFDKQGRSPLHVAVELGNTFMVQRLIEGGADPNLASSLNQGRTPIFMAVENKWDELTEYLSGKANLDICLDDGRSLHHVAAQSGSPEWIAALEKPAVSQQRKTPPGGGDDRFPSGSSTREALRHRSLSPLYVAVADAYTEGVELLVKHRAKLPAWGLTEEEKAKCLKVALEISNTPIALPLLELFGKETIWDAIPQLIAAGNDEIIGKVKARIPEETAYKVLIGKGLHTKQIDMVSFVLTTWPKPLADLAVLAVELCAASMPNQETPTSELLGIMVEKYVADYIRDTDQAAQDRKQSSLLTQALEGRHLRAATVLIDRGADLHHTTLDTLTWPTEW